MTLAPRLDFKLKIGVMILHTSPDAQLLDFYLSSGNQDMSITLITDLKPGIEIINFIIDVIMNGYFTNNYC